MEDNLEEQLVAKLREWFLRSAVRMSVDYFNIAEIKFALHQAGAEEDGTLHLEAKVIEKMTHDDLAGAVPGVKLQLGDHPQGELAK